MAVLLADRFPAAANYNYVKIKKINKKQNNETQGVAIFKAQT